MFVISLVSNNKSVRRRHETVLHMTKEVKWVWTAVRVFI